ncbi:LOW QUALITY PROTEIN: protein phosphatase 1 regulatory subunit 32 [Melanotaenia boesemani]|uniref:LOW QUALITY PROTEIN: protein phosphatase 1 regulatory subunit 32 n=1 Tax=Melanotaenia boesemani TaxID=1250792 RepID=UPI001C054D96|nr:LOW QUALITY PROTEIN: protein phosphatase 1 regulatory subunit 32 [Melanotaenia boesemani]
MAEQKKIVMPTVGATGGRQLSSNEIYNESYRESNGGSTDRMTGHASGTDLTSNQRPAAYKPSLNLTDSPQFGCVVYVSMLSLSNSFLSQTEQDNQLHAHSGFLPNLIKTHKLPSALESFNNSTCGEKVLPDQVMGSKPKTGFTEGTDLQLYTFKEKTSNTVEPHQIYSSMMKTDFIPLPLQQSTEVIPGLCSRSCRESGYTRGVVAPFAWPSSLLPSPQTKSSAPTVKTTGKREPTGFLQNVPRNQVFPKTPFELSHFITHYQIT